MGVSVYTVANDRFFPGLVGLVTSLRVNGHTGPIVVVDTGLTPAQVEALSDAATLIQAPADLRKHYAFSKPFGPLERPDDLMLFIDADILCVRPLDEIINQVQLGSIVVFEDIGRPGQTAETWREWEERLQIGGLEPRTYVNGGFFAVPRASGIAFFQALADGVERVDPHETHIGAADEDLSLPFFILDQDVANALLASPEFRARTVTLPYRYAPHAPFGGVRVDGDLTCVDDAGTRPFFLHHALQKPWLEPLPSNPYTQLLVEYVHHPAAPVVDERELPLFLRRGHVAFIAREARSTRGTVRSRVRGKLGLRPFLQKKTQHLLQR